MFSEGRNSRAHFANLLIPIGIMALFVLYQSWPIFTEPQYYSDDQHSNWLLAVRQYDPTFLSRDYAFGDPLFQGHYIPVYLFLLHTLRRFLGGVDPAMIFLHSILLPGYLVSMFILLRYITGSNLVAAFVAIVSALSRGSIAQEIWAATDMRAVMPRTAFLVTVPLLTLFLFRWLPARQWWRLPLLGLFTGLAANLHPPSGLFFLQIMLTLVVIFSSVSFRVKLYQVVLAVFGFILGGLPTVWAVLKGILQSRQLIPSGSFQEFADILHQRMRTEFPFPPEQVNFVGISLTKSQQSTIVVLYLLGMGLWLGVALWLRRRSLMKIEVKSKPLNWMLAWLLILNIPLAYLVSTFIALDLILVTAAYWGTRLIRQDYDSLDGWTLSILVCASAYSFAGSAVLGWMWETFELWSMTSFFGEQARMSRFVYLPLYIFLARWLYLLLFQSRDRRLSITIVLGLIGGLTVRHWHFLDPWGATEWGMAVSLLVLAITGTWLLSTKTVPLSASAMAIIVSFGATAYLWLYIVGVNFPWLWGLALGGGLLAGLARWYWDQPVWRWLATTGLVGVIFFGIFFGPRLSVLTDQKPSAPLRTQAMKALGLYEYGIPSDRPESLAFYEWVNNHTDENALFYFNDRQYEFRALARRAVTHSWKDIGGSYYTPPLAIEYYRRFQKLDTAYQDSNRLLACAQAYGANYIVTKNGQTSLGLPVVYANNLYSVYAMDGSATVDLALCQ